MQRVLEPELMDAWDQAEAYATADFAEVNQAFSHRFIASFPDFRRGRMIDLGCGPADIPIRLCRLLPGIQVTAVDGSTPMLAFAHRAVAATGLDSRIELIAGRVPGTPPAKDGQRFGAVISNSLLHHLPDPTVFWREVATVAQTGAAVLVTDLLRPGSKRVAQALVDHYAAEESPVLRRDFFNSLCAAFTVNEIEDQLARAGLSSALTVRQASDRHWVAAGRM